MKTAAIKITFVFFLAVSALNGNANQLESDLDAKLSQNTVVHVSAEEAKRVLQNHESIIVLDVRTIDEHRENAIRRDLNIDYYSPSFAKELDKLDKDKTYLVHCRSGVRSGKALSILQGLGFNNILHLDGGMKAWQALD